MKIEFPWNYRSIFGHFSVSVRTSKISNLRRKIYGRRRDLRKKKKLWSFDWQFYFENNNKNQRRKRKNYPKENCYCLYESWFHRRQHLTGLWNRHHLQTKKNLIESYWFLLNLSVCLFFFQQGTVEFLCVFRTQSLRESSET